MKKKEPMKPKKPMMKKEIMGKEHMKVGKISDHMEKLYKKGKK